MRWLKSFLIITGVFKLVMEQCSAKWLSIKDYFDWAITVNSTSKLIQLSGKIATSACMVNDRLRETDVTPAYEKVYFCVNNKCLIMKCF